MGAVLPVLAIAGSVIGGAASFASARAQNNAIRTSQQSAREAAAAQQQQLLDQTAAERRKRIVESQQITGRIRAAAAESGGLGGTTEALLRQNALDTQMNDQNIQMSYRNNAERIRSGLNADLAQLSASSRNILLDTFMGTASGGSAGLSIGSGYNSVRDYMNSSRRDPSGRAK